MRRSRIRIPDIIKADKNYPLGTSNVRNIGSRLIGTAMKAVGMEPENASVKKNKKIIKSI